MILLATHRPLDVLVTQRGDSRFSRGERRRLIQAALEASRLQVDDTQGGVLLQAQSLCRETLAALPESPLGREYARAEELRRKELLRHFYSRD